MSIVIEFEAYDASRFEWQVGVPFTHASKFEYGVQTEFGASLESRSGTVAVEPTPSFYASRGAGGGLTDLARVMRPAGGPARSFVAQAR